MYCINCTDDIFSTLIIENPSLYFPDYVDNYLKSYIRYCNNLLSLNKEKDTILHKLTEFQKLIRACLQEHCCGQRHNAKKFFDDALTQIPVMSLCSPVQHNIYYRARPTKVIEQTGQHVKHTKDEMFHIPFEDRYKVSDQRYSYPGLPCLYLGESVDVCCEELEKWDEDLNLAIYRLNTAEKQMLIMDLFFFEKYKFDNLTNEQFVKFVLLWPIVACCSFRYNNPIGMKYRQDYILPQFLLETIIDNNAMNVILQRKLHISGIRYHSARKDFFGDDFSVASPTYVNYAFPAQKVFPRGYCSVLLNSFNCRGVFLLSELRK